MRIRDFLKSGHPGTLCTSFLYFDITFAVWVLNSALAPYISEEFGLSPAQKGFMTAVPVFAGALLRFPLGLLSQYIGRKRAAQVNMGVLVAGLLGGYFLSASYGGVIALGAILGIAGASFGVALSLGSGWFPPQYKGLAMGIAGACNSGAVLAVLFAPPLAKAFGWQYVYMLAAIPMVATMVALQLFAKEPPDIEKMKVRDILKMLVDRDVWIFNVVYALTFGGYLGLTAFLPTLFHDQYSIAKEDVGKYAAGIIVMASILRILGGSIADRFGGLRVLFVLCGLAIATTSVAALIPANPWVMVAVLVVCFSALGAGNGAVFQLVPLRFKATTAVAGSLIGEVGALAGSFVPVTMGYSFKLTGSFSSGFLSGTALAAVALGCLWSVVHEWTTTWVGAGGKALPTTDAAPVLIDDEPEPGAIPVGAS
jgi:MFS transporter, NNP family, nitrate/nitrite transporter